MPSAFSPSFPLWEESFMKINHILLISLLIVGALFIPAVSAETIEGQIHEVTLPREEIPAIETEPHGSMFIPAFGLLYDPVTGLIPSAIYLRDVQLYPQNLADYDNYPDYAEFNGELRLGTSTIVVCDVKLEYFKGDYIPSEGRTYGNVRITFTDWDYNRLQTLTEKTQLRIGGTPDTDPYMNIWRLYPSAALPSGDPPVIFCDYFYGLQPASRSGHHEYFYQPVYFINNYTISIDEDGTDIYITRSFDDDFYPSKIIVSKSDGTLLYKSSDYETANRVYSFPYRDLIVDIEAVDGKTYRILGDTTTPTDPDSPPLRRGSVTMTDHNGTTITGFEVTAVNYYTGESHTVSTETDVAVMNLPMDRTVEIRNPQTGAYEEAPVGYYRFYGQAPGYKMLNEEGIKVAVMPEKYGSYKLCDILVTAESGPLTGKHQFQIRSRSDFSILQTGTISAKSRTTGDWYNTTVVNGLATLILPYDTSDALSEYAGHYYVYATSPGYEDSDYGTQIAIYPHTVSEVRTILLTPIGGVPTPGNLTLRIQAISETGQGVANAEIFIAGVIGAGQDVWDTYTTSSSGYLAVSVPGNSTYDIVARGVGYYDSSRRIQVFTEDPALIEIRLYLSGAPTLEPTVEPTGWPTGPPTTQPTSGIPDEDDGSGGFLMQAVRGIGNAFGVGFSTAKIIFGMLLALSIGFATAKQLRGGAAEFGLGLLGGTMLGVLIGLIPVWTIVVLLLVVGLYIGNRYVGGGGNNG